MSRRAFLRIWLKWFVLPPASIGVSAAIPLSHGERLRVGAVKARHATNLVSIKQVVDRVSRERLGGFRVLEQTRDVLRWLTDTNKTPAAGAEPVFLTHAPHRQVRDPIRLLGLHGPKRLRLARENGRLLAASQTERQEKSDGGGVRGAGRLPALSPAVVGDVYPHFAFRPGGIAL